MAYRVRVRVGVRLGLEGIERRKQEDPPPLSFTSSRLDGLYRLYPLRIDQSRLVGSYPKIHVHGRWVGMDRYPLGISLHRE